MLDDIELPGGLGDLNLLAGWFLGSAVVCLVIVGALAALRWAGGKAFGFTEASQKGLVGIYMLCAGSLVLGSVGGAIQWSSTSGRTEALLPEAAKQGEISVDRPEASTHCQATVSVQESKHRQTGGAGRDDLRPEDDEHEWLRTLADDLGAFGMEATKAYGKSLAWWWNPVSVDPAEWQDQETLAEEKDARFSKVEWLPDGQGQDCTIENRSAAAGRPVTVVMWEKTRTGGGQYVVYELEVPEN